MLTRFLTGWLKAHTCEIEDLRIRKKVYELKAREIGAEIERRMSEPALQKMREGGL